MVVLVVCKLLGLLVIGTDNIPNAAVNVVDSLSNQPQLDPITLISAPRLWRDCRDAEPCYCGAQPLAGFTYRKFSLHGGTCGYNWHGYVWNFQ